ncbi:hypothetical protein jhhlp_000860 [Lomentospora prolificans]|uniref:Uncharacterized protein n=1 Tax=Lomentospora prolificans TaxID=41688 RepID=A0A2N3NJX3_9PEZI|nr:hypothetical protein jhhlp_000860 [Lomentospora prolificans]
MRFQSNFQLLAVALNTASLAAAYELIFYRGEGCRSENLGHWVGGPNQGCRNDNMGVAQSVIVKSTGAVDDPHMITFFSSDDCDPRTEIQHGDEDSGCFTVNYGSYVIWDVYS